MSRDDALFYLIIGAGVLITGLLLLVWALRDKDKNEKAAVYFYRHRDRTNITVVFLGFGALLVTGSSLYAIDAHAPSWVNWLVGLLLAVELLVSLVFLILFRRSGLKQLEAEELEQEHRQEFPHRED